MQSQPLLPLSRINSRVPVGGRKGNTKGAARDPTRVTKHTSPSLLLCQLLGRVRGLVSRQVELVGVSGNGLILIGLCPSAVCEMECGSPERKT